MIAVNDSTPGPSASQPRALLIINDVAVGGVISVDVDQNAYYQADTFRATLALSVQPPGLGAAWWAEIREAEVEVLMGYPPNPQQYARGDLASVFIGIVDDIEIDPTSDRILLVGRDLTSRFLDNKTVEQYRNLTASQIAETLAAKRGLKADVTPTKAKAGKYYAQDHVDVEDARPEWDLLTYLAEVEGFRVFVRGRTLVFGPGLQDDVPYVIRWDPPDAQHAAPRSNALALAMRRNLTVSRSIIVEVRSWNSKQQKGFTETARRNKTLNTLTTQSRTKGVVRTPASPQKYVFVVANLTPQQAQEYANVKAEQISQHELVIQARLIGDDKLTITRPVVLEGTGTAFDQTFFPASIVRRYSTDEGYVMDVSAKNHDANSEALP